MRLMLIEIVKRIFESNGFQALELLCPYDGLQAFLFKPCSESGKEEFFLLLEYSNPTEDIFRALLNEVADEWYLSIRQQEGVDKAFAKNCTMIICSPIVVMPSRLVFDIEEDKYNFKKNVISYSDSELRSLEGLTQDLTVAEINRIINHNSGQEFQKFKRSSGNTENYYSLLLKIFVKLPFIRYLHAPKTLDDLEGLIRSSLSEEELSLYLNVLSLDLSQSDVLVENILLADIGLNNA
jgi:hypothetical protein